MVKWSLKRGDGEAGSRDWMVLTTVLICTGLAVLNTVVTDKHSALRPLDSDLQGQIVLTMYADEHTFCDGGIAALQEKEDLRAAASIARGKPPQAVDVVYWILHNHLEQSDEALLADYGSYLSKINTEEWTRDTTLAVAIECEIQRRGLV